MPDTDNAHIPAASDNHRETGGRKLEADPTQGRNAGDGNRRARAHPGDPAVSGNLQDGISRGGTITGDPDDSPPKDGYGLTEKVNEVDDKTRKSDGLPQKP